jgi:hypothetical protein
LRVRDRLWAVGDITGIWPLTHVGKYQTEVAASNILGNILGEPREERATQQPGVIYVFAYLCRRDLFVDPRTLADKNWHECLSTQELGLLAGLMLKHPLQNGYPTEVAGAQHRAPGLFVHHSCELRHPTMSRLATCVMMAGIELSHGTVRENIGDALDLVVHIDRREGKRSVSEVLRVVGYDIRNNRFDLESLYKRSAGLETE